jgi:hypothetical protein
MPPFVEADSITDATRSLAHVTAGLAGVTTLLAIATVVLVLVTRSGMKSAHRDTEELIAATNAQVAATREAAKSEIEATQNAADRQVAAARQQLDAEHLPFLIEVRPNGPLFPDMESRANPSVRAGEPGSLPVRMTMSTAIRFANAREVEEVDPRALVVRIERGMAFVSLPLRNVGRGLAIIDTANMTLQGLPWIGKQKTYPRAEPERVPPGETTRIYLISEYHTIGDQQGPTRMTHEDRWTLRVPYRDFAWEQPSTLEILLGYEGDGAAVGTWFVSTVRAVAPWTQEAAYAAVRNQAANAEDLPEI